MRTIRVWFSKIGEAVYISHLDLQRVMHRALAKAGIPAWYSLGFNPHMYITFPLPLPLGQEGLCEAMDFRTEDEELNAQTICDALNAALPQGLRVHGAGAPQHKAGQIAAASYRMILPALDGRMQAAIDAYNAAPQALVTRLGKENGRKTQKQTDLKASLPAITTQQTPQGLLLELTLPAGSSVNCNPALLLQYLEKTAGLPCDGASICRTRILLADGTPFA